MLALTAPTSAQLVAGAVGPVMLGELDFASGTQYISTWNDYMTIGGNVYIPMSGNLSVGTVGESEDSSVDQIVLKVPLVNQSFMALTMTSVEAYRGKPARLYLQLMAENYQPVGSKVLRYVGYMEPIKVTHETQGDNPGLGAPGFVEMPLSRGGLVRSRNYDGLRATHAQHKQRYPGDNGLEYILGLINLPTPWLTKKFQRI